MGHFKVLSCTSFLLDRSAKKHAILTKKIIVTFTIQKDHRIIVIFIHNRAALLLTHYALLPSPKYNECKAIEHAASNRLGIYVFFAVHKVLS